MSRSVQLYLDGMIKSCEKILKYTEDMTFEALISDDRTYDAVIRNLEILGEAAKQIPQNLRNRASEIE